MKTKTRKVTRSTVNARNGQDAADTNEKYEARLFWTQYNQGAVIIKAKSLAEATEKADEIEIDEVSWSPVDGDIFVLSVELVKGERSHD